MLRMLSGCTSPPWACQCEPCSFLKVVTPNIDDSIPDDMPEAIVAVLIIDTRAFLSCAPNTASVQWMLACHAAYLTIARLWIEVSTTQHQSSATWQPSVGTLVGARCED